MKTMNFDQLKRLKSQNENFLLVNVLPAKDFSGAKIPGSLNIPLEEPDFERRVEKAAMGKQNKVVVYCASLECPASRNAAEKLEKAGFTDVSAYEGGAKEWQEKTGGREAA